MGSECPRDPVSLGLESRIVKPYFASTYVTISMHACSNVRKRFELSIKCFSTSSTTNASRPARLISSSAFNFFAQHVGFPSFDPRLKFQHLPREIIFRSKFHLIPPVVGPKTFLQSSPCLQRVLPRVGDNVICSIARESHECCVHLLQHELQVVISSCRIRHNRQEFQIDGCRRDFRRPFS